MNQYTISDIQAMADSVSRSNLWPMDFHKAVSIMLVSQSQGKHPMSAIMSYHIVQNKLSMKSDAMLAGFHNAGGVHKWIERTDTICTGEFTHKSGGTLIVTWTIDRAKNSKLYRDGPWKQYPAQMLSARVVSEGVKAVFPAIAEGLYTPEEVSDFSEPEKKQKPEKKPKPDFKILEKFCNDNFGNTELLFKTVKNWNARCKEYKIVEDEWRRGFEFCITCINQSIETSIKNKSKNEILEIQAKIKTLGINAGLDESIIVKFESICFFSTQNTKQKNQHGDGLGLDMDKSAHE